MAFDVIYAKDSSPKTIAGSFATGYRPAPEPSERLDDDRSVQAYCLRLERSGEAELAQEILEIYCIHGYVPSALRH